MKILVTYGGGFIGSHLVDHFALIEADIQSYGHSVVRGCEAVPHHAAPRSVPCSLCRGAEVAEWT